MPEAHIIFDLHTFWHAGSGRGRSAILDAEVVRDASGLPYLPGKSVKGLLRKAMRIAAAVGDVPPDAEERIFGSAVPGLGDSPDLDTLEEDQDPGDAQDLALERGRFATKMGNVWFGSAELPEAWRVWARSAGASDRSEVIAQLFDVVASTAIDEHGVAKEATLRVVEVTAPMRLEAVVAGHDPAAFGEALEHLEKSLPYMRAVGSRTRRGYGRCTVKLERKEA